MSILISFINALYCTTAVQTYWRSHKHGISQSFYCRLIDESVKNNQPDTFQTVDLTREFESNASSELNELWVQNMIDSLNEVNNNVQGVGTLEQSEETGYYYDLYDFGLEEVVTNPKIDNKRVKIECENVINDWSDNGILNDKSKLITPQNIKIPNTNAPVVEDQKKITNETIPIEERQAFGDEETTYLVQPEKGKRHGFFCAIIAFCKKVVNRFFRAKK